MDAEKVQSRRHFPPSQEAFKNSTLGPPSSTNHYRFAVEPEGLCYLEAPVRVESLNTKAKRGGKQKAPRRDGEGMQEGGRMKVVSSQPFVLSSLSDAKS